jgi:hypothetical protein
MTDKDNYERFVTKAGDFQPVTKKKNTDRFVEQPGETYVVTPAPKKKPKSTKKPKK